MEDQTIWVPNVRGPLAGGLAGALSRAGNFVVVSGDGARELSRENTGMAVVEARANSEEGFRQVHGQLRELTDRLDLVLLQVADFEALSGNVLDWRVYERQMAANLVGAVRLLELAVPLLARSRAPYLVLLSGREAADGMDGAEAFAVVQASVESLVAKLASGLDFPLDVSVIRYGVAALGLGDEEQSVEAVVSGGLDEAVSAALGSMERRQQLIRVPRVHPWLEGIAERLGAMRRRGDGLPGRFGRGEVL